MTVFQFHKGTIRTLIKVLIYAFGLIFQFHKGAIRTQIEQTNLDWLPHFNSIKVRLER